jgi:hypothetical protein
MAFKKLVRRDVISIRVGRGPVWEPRSYQYRGRTDFENAHRIALGTLVRHVRNRHRECPVSIAELGNYVYPFVSASLRFFGEAKETKPYLFTDGFAVAVVCPICEDYFVDLVIGRLGEGPYSIQAEEFTPYDGFPGEAEYTRLRELYGPKSEWQP